MLVCQSGARAEQARQRLHQAGVDSAVVLEGGAAAYAAAGGEVVRGEQRWAMGAALSRMPWNRGAQDPEAHVALGRLPQVD